MQTKYDAKPSNKPGGVQHLLVALIAILGLGAMSGQAIAAGEHLVGHADAVTNATPLIKQNQKQSRPVQQDCADCPVMALIPAGEFVMGDTFGRTDEQPAHKVQIARPFLMSVFEVSFAEWKACLDDGGCTRMPGDEGWGRTGRPVIGVSWHDAVAYTVWLSSKSGHTYRLPTEAEWEYAARAGSTTQYWWGDGYEDAEAAFCGSKWDSKRTQPVGAFPPNEFGLHDTLGNVWEWVQDCYNPQGYVDTDGSARAYLASANGQSCARVLRGGSWQTYPRLLRSARRYSGSENGRYSDAGLRVVRDLNGQEVSVK